MTPLLRIKTISLEWLATVAVPDVEQPIDLLEPSAKTLAVFVTRGLLDRPCWALLGVLLAAPTVATCALIATLLALEQR